MKRFHTKTLLAEDTVAAHSYVVAWLVTLGSNYAPSAPLLLAALQHDVPEAELGDMPGPTKLALGLGGQFAAEESKIFRAAGMPDFSEDLSDSEIALLKLADNLSGWLTCVYEESLGNKTLRTSRVNYRNYILRVTNKHPEHADFAMAVMLAAELREEEQSR